MRNAVESVVASIKIHVNIGLLAVMAKNMAARNRFNKMKYSLTREWIFVTLVDPMIFLADSCLRYSTEYATAASPTQAVISIAMAPSASTEKNGNGA